MSADMVSVIAGVLAVHWTFSTDTDDYPRFVDRCDGCHEIVFNHGRENNQNQSYAAHQARAVLDAISEAGAVEWGVFRITDAPVMRPFDEAKFTTKTAAEVFIKLGFLERVAKTLEPRSRITGPWERAE